MSANACRWLVAAAALGLAACSLAHVEAPQADVGPADAAVERDAAPAADAWAPDDAPDAPVPGDAALPPADAFDPPDGSPWDPEWRQLALAPADCHVEVAAHPERLSWPSGRVFAATRIGGRDAFDLDPAPGGSFPVAYRGLARADGTVLTALRLFGDAASGGSCWIDDLATHGSEVAVHLGYCGEGSPCGLFGNWVSHVYRGRSDDFAGTHRRIAEYTVWLGTDTPPAPRIAVGDTVTTVVDLNGLVHVVLADGTLAEVGSAASRPIQLGDDTLFVDATSGHLVRSSGGAPAREVRDDAGAPIAWLGTDGTSIAWLAPETELFAGTYDGALHGAHVRTGHGLAGTVGGGYAARMEATSNPSPHYVLTVDRLADGRRAVVDFPEHSTLWNAAPVLLVAEDEILVGSRDGRDVLAGIRRIDPRTLTFL